MARAKMKKPAAPRRVTRAPKPAAPRVEVSRDVALRMLVEEHPTDDATIAVYADWLEEQGDMPRASFLRMQQKLRAMKLASPKLLERGRALFDLGATLPSEWVAAVTYPKITGTAWDGADTDGDLVLRFLPSGFVNYTQPSGTYENGRWTQIGNAVAMETNAHYADYFGVIVGDTMRGNAHNIVNYKWRWKVKLTADDTIARVPDTVNRTIHDDHIRARAVAKPPRVRAKPPKKPGRKKPLTRKTPMKRTASPKRRAKRP
jgi:uncharacterized protein (TIGR02996 family)